MVALDLKFFLNDKKEKSNNKKLIGAYITFGIILLLALVLISVVWWSNDYFGVGFGHILSTMTAPMKGANSNEVLLDAFKGCLPIICPPLLLYGLFIFIDIKFDFSISLKGKAKSLNSYLRRFLAVVCTLLFVFSLFYANNVYGVLDYIKIKNDTTTIYDDYYVDPNTVSITNDGNTKNLICIYLESMETSYASKGQGGFQEENLIPNLTELANDNISFSNTKGFGGFYSLTGTTWTIGSIFALNSGVPYSFPIKDNFTKNQEGSFADGITTLGDILDSKGYVQEFLCGSDADFADRRDFFTSHGNYKIFDYYSAIDNGYIDKDYHKFWGIEDKKLYSIAKDEITKLSKSGKPFNFSMLTVDTHFPSGYECENCGDDYENKAENVVACADRQINSFIEWCKQQDFYENTVIVVLGDHPRAEQVLVPKQFKGAERTVYNCIINSKNTTETINQQNRTFTAMDYFPTVLSAMGFSIEGDRLGLGTNLFSDKQTLPEELGFENFENEISKRSDYYIENFS